MFGTGKRARSNTETMDLDVHVELAAETVFHLGPIPITNSMLTMWGVMALILLVFWLAARKGALIPGRFQSTIELIVEFISDLVYGTAGRRLGRRVLPLIMGLFVFIWIANLSGLLPGVGTIGQYHEAAHSEEVVDDHAEGDAAVDDEHAPASESQEAVETDAEDATAATNATLH